jgi:c-di-GMP-binding flagellar brake protein YcgR
VNSHLNYPQTEGRKPVAVKPDTLSLSQKDEKILIQESCLKMRGPLGSSGVLTLTGKRLLFHPTGLADKIMGRAHVIELEDIKQVTVDDRKDVCVVEAGKKYRFGGSGARRVGVRLEALLSRRDGGEAVEGVDLFDEDERVIVGGPLYLVITGFIGAHGEVMLTDSRLIFEVSTGLESVFWPSRVKDLEIELGQIQEVELVGFRRRLRIVESNGTHMFSGVLASKLYTVLKSLRTEQSQNEGGERLLGTWDVSVFNGPLASQGQLLISSHRLSFEPSGRLDAAFGMGRREVTWPEVHELLCAGWPERRVQVHTATDKLAFSVTGPVERFMDLIPLLLEQGEAFLDEQGFEPDASDRDRLEKILEGREIPGEGRDLIGLETAAYWLTRLHVTRGWLVLTRDWLHYVPIKEESGTILSFEFDLVIPPSGEAEDDSHLVFDYSGKTQDFVPLLGQTLIHRFWTLVEKQGRARWEEKLGGNFRDLIGEQPSLELYYDSKLVAKLKPAQTVAHFYGFGIVFPGELPEGLDPGSGVRVSVSTDGARYSFDGTVVSAESYRTASGDGGKEGSLRILVIAHPPMLRLDNRRRHYRTNTSIPIRMKPVAQPDDEAPPKAQRCVLHDLSLGGVGLYASERLSKGRRLRLQIQEGDYKVVTTAKVMAAKRDLEGAMPWLHRLEFLSMNRQKRETLEEIVMLIQRDSIADESPKL